MICSNFPIARIIAIFICCTLLNLKGAFCLSKAQLQDELLEAAEMGNAEVVEKIIAEKKADLEMAWQHNTPLLLAATNNRLKVCELLLNAGVDVNVMARDGTRPITTASYHGHLDIVKLLIKHGADLKFTDSSASDVSNPLIVAASNNQARVIKLLLANGAIIDLPSNSGDSALILASLNGHYESAEILLKNGANIEHKNHQGNTALLAAAYKGQCNVVDLLIRRGADVHRRNHDSSFALLSAASNGYTRCAKLLAQAGVDVSAMDRLNNTAISMAARSNFIDVVRILIEYGANLEQTDDLKMTALHHALSHNHLKTVKILALAGVNFGPSKNHDGVSQNNIAKIEVCDWFRSILIHNNLPTKQQTGHRKHAPMKACAWLRHLGFDGSIVPLLDQVQLYGYAAIVRLLKFELFARGDKDAYSLDKTVRKAYIDIKDMHSKEYRVAYRYTDETVIEDELPGLLKNNFGMNITLPEPDKDDDDKKPKEPEEILPQIHRPDPVERPEFAKNKPGEEDLEEVIAEFKASQAALAAVNETAKIANATTEDKVKVTNEKDSHGDDSMAAEL